MVPVNSSILKLPENTNGRDFVVGDIHGAFDLLDQALLAVNFDPEKDRLIAVGDLIDRGDRSPDCLYYLAQPWFYSIRGNHEDLFLWLFEGGHLNPDRMEKCKHAGIAWMSEITQETLEDLRDAFKSLPVIIEIETSEGPIGFVHGDIPAQMDWETFKQRIEAGDKDTRKTATTGRERLHSKNEEGVEKVFRVFFGHTTIEGGPQSLGNCFYIDTGAVFKLIEKNNTHDFFMALVDIKAPEDDIRHPTQTAIELVRLAQVHKKAAPRL